MPQERQVECARESAERGESRRAATNGEREREREKEITSERRERERAREGLWGREEG